VNRQPNETHEIIAAGESAVHDERTGSDAT